MRFSIALLLASLCLTSAGLAQQRPPSQPDWSGTVGVGMAVFPKYAGSDQYRVLPIPLVGVQYKGRFFLGGGSSGPGGGIGAYVVRNGTWSWGVTFGGGDARPESRGDALAGMGDRDISLNAGTSLGYTRGILRTSVGVTRGFNDGAGWTGSVDAGLGSRLGGRWFGSLGVGATLADGKQMRYDFGVDNAQAARRDVLIANGDERLSGVDAGPYVPDAGLQSVRLSGSIGYALSLRWTALGFVSASRLEGDAARSPLVVQRHGVVTGFGVSYRW